MVDFDAGRTREFWWAIGALLLAALAFVVYAFIGTLVFAVFIYYATRPVYVRVRRRVSHPSVAASVALLTFTLPAISLLVYTVAITIQEIAALDSQMLGPAIKYIEPYTDVSGLVQEPSSLLTGGNLQTVRETAATGLQYLGFVANGLIHLFVMFALAYYMLKDGSRFSAWLRQFGDDRGVFDAYLSEVDQSFQSIFFGNILTAILTGAIGAITFSVLNLFAPAGLAIPYPALLGVLTGVASLIPVVGMKIIYVPFLALLTGRALMSNTGYVFVAVVGLVTFVVVDALPDFILRPYVSGRNLHIGLVMLAYIFGPLLFGWYGLFLGPIILVLLFHFGRIVLPELLSGEPIRPVAVDPTHITDSRSTPPPDTKPAPGATDPATEPDEDAAIEETGEGGDESVGPDGDGSE